MEWSLQYYDLVLVAIIASLGLGVAVGVWTPVSLYLAISALGVLSIGLVGHALFVRGPVDRLPDLSDEVAAEELPVPDRLAVASE